MLDTMEIKVTLKNERILVKDATNMEISVESDVLEEISPQTLHILPADDKKTFYFYAKTKTVMAGQHEGEVVVKYLEGSDQKTASQPFRFKIIYPGIQISTPSKLSGKDNKTVPLQITLKNGDIMDYKSVEVHLSTPTPQHVAFESEMIELGKIIHGEVRSFEIYITGYKAGVVETTAIINIDVLYNGVVVTSSETHFEIS
ncbi:MAG: hypothetical protein GKB99_04255 [Methanocellales archaeon]|nr:hypothetical protein [Methanocellales archaeon]